MFILNKSATAISKFHISYKRSTFAHPGVMVCIKIWFVVDMVACGASPPPLWHAVDMLLLHHEPARPSSSGQTHKVRHDSKILSDQTTTIATCYVLKPCFCL